MSSSSFSKGTPESINLASLVKHAGVQHPLSFDQDLHNATVTSMNLVEGLELLKHMRMARRYLEWGSGGSTVLASWLTLLHSAHAYSQQSSLEELVSIESSDLFVKGLIQRHRPIQRAVAKGSLNYIIAHVGPTKAWGHPAVWTGSNAQREMWLQQYVAAVPPASCCFDTIVVDGRFREACSLHALLLSHENTTLLVHDNGGVNDRRPYNRTLKKWYTFERQAETLSVLRPMPTRLKHAKENREVFIQALSTAMGTPLRRI